MSTLNKEEVCTAYEDVRADDTETTWLICRYNEKEIGVSGTGTDIEECFNQLTDDERAFIYIRLETGDEMSKRAKFAFITWIGPDVGALKKAKTSTDKATVKKVVSIFAKEFLVDTKHDLNLGRIEEEVRKAGGANYGTGSR
ncbi:coactosin-like protein [Antedon mediterranea]|uniref:coactosin-like protein n=1 Tax=Antedon mediterranea TaxID=105859 RepID=UPI003AF84F31